MATNSGRIDEQGPRPPGRFEEFNISFEIPFLCLDGRLVAAKRLSVRNSRTQVADAAGKEWQVGFM